MGGFRLFQLGSGGPVRAGPGPRGAKSEFSGHGHVYVCVHVHICRICSCCRYLPLSLFTAVSATLVLESLSQHS